jgi:hypothetical protein
MNKTALILAILALPGFGLEACGGASSAVRSKALAGTRVDGALHGDQDHDSQAGGYYDADDGEISDYGHTASAADLLAVTALVERYYAAAAAGNGAHACALTYYFESETLPEQYGEPPGPRWLAGASTCEAVLSRVFAHYHTQLTAPVTVRAVRVDGDRAEALVGFRTLPAGYVKLRREAGMWKIDSLLAIPLP